MNNRERLNELRINMMELRSEFENLGEDMLEKQQKNSFVNLILYNLNAAIAYTERELGLPPDAGDRASYVPANWPQQLKDMEARKDAAYLERNQVVAALAKCFPSGTARTAIEGWSDDWHSCVYIDLPTGQASWHYHDSHAYLFKDLPPYSGEWDGHTTERKYERLAEMVPREPDAWVHVYYKIGGGGLYEVTNFGSKEQHQEPNPGYKYEGSRPLYESPTRDGLDISMYESMRKPPAEKEVLK